jgi:hypothetical protein
VPARPSRREVLIASGIALLVLVAGVIAAVVTVGSVKPPSYATDEPIVTSLLASATELPGWQSGPQQILSPSKLAGDTGIEPSAAELQTDADCAFIFGPTMLKQVTALGVNTFDEGSGASQAELLSEAVTYENSAPVTRDATDAHRSDFAACTARLLAQSAGDASELSNATLDPVSLGARLGNVDSVALAGSWTTSFNESGGPALGQLHIDIVVLTRSRAEVILVIEDVGSAVPRSLLDRLALGSARALEAHLA